MLANFSGVKSERTISKFRKRERKLLCSFKPEHENRTSVSCRGHAMTAKKCTENCDAHAKLLNCLYKSVPFFAVLVAINIIVA